MEKPRAYRYEAAYNKYIIKRIGTALNMVSVGAVKVTASSIEKGKEIYLVDKTPKEAWTKEIPSSWFAIDLRHVTIASDMCQNVTPPP